MDLNKIKTNFILAHEEFSEYLDDARTRPCKLCAISKYRKNNETYIAFFNCFYCTMNNPLYKSIPCIKMQTYLQAFKIDSSGKQHSYRKKIDINKKDITTKDKLLYHKIKRRKSFHKQAAAYLRTLRPEDFAPDKMHVIGKKLWEIDNDCFKFETYKIKNG